MMGPQICLEVSGVVAVIKPAGLPTQAPPGIDSLELWLRSELPPGGYLGVPHRLDRAVSGVMLFAVTPRAARQLSRQFERRHIAKTYLAVIERGDAGGLSRGQDAVDNDGWDTWIDWLAKIPDQPRARLATADEPGSRQAQTRARHIGSFAAPDGASLAMLQLEPRTGRMHQLRVQAASRGMPIVGDTLYGARCGWAAESGGGDREREAIALHAWRIAFTDPETKEPRAIEAPLPESWPAACTKLLVAAESAAITKQGPSRSG
jgi:23S rRNA pseudouridine1911/1915/1917 synthase